MQQGTTIAASTGAARSGIERIETDVVVIGAGIAGASVAYELAATFKVIVLERESQPGYHSTGRSAALFSEIYGNADVRRLTRCSRAFLEGPPAGFAAGRLLSPRGVLFIAGHAQQQHFDAICKAAAGSLRLLSQTEALRRVPILRPEMAELAAMELDARDIEVHSLHQGYLRGLRTRGGQIVCNCCISALHRVHGQWNVDAGDQLYLAPLLVNAAGAWADTVAQLAGVAAIGLVPKRRTVALIDPPPGVSIQGWPLVADVDETLYFKSDAGKILISPADATPCEPCDAQPEELDVAIAVDRYERLTTVQVGRITHRWAGLRTFAADSSPIAGFDPNAAGFFWLAGQGGYGVQIAPALARAAAALARGQQLPPDLRACGLSESSLSPARLRIAPSPAVDADRHAGIADA